MLMSHGEITNYISPFFSSRFFFMFNSDSNCFAKFWLKSILYLILSQSSSAENQVSRYEEQLEKLETRMEGILERYTKQFAAMESIVGQLTSMRENLKSQFEAMLNTGKN